MTSTACAPARAALLISLMVLTVLCCPAPAIKTASLAAREASITSRYSRSSRWTRSPVEPSITKPITPRALHSLIFEVMSVVEIWLSRSNGVVVGRRIPFRSSIISYTDETLNRVSRTERGSAGSTSGITTFQTIDPALPRSVLLTLPRSLVKQIPNSDRKEDIPAAFAGPLLHVPCITEREMSRRRELKANSGARAVTRPTSRADPRHVKHDHRTNRIDIYVIKQRVESATRERHVGSRLFLRAVFIDLCKLRGHCFSQCLNAARRGADVGIMQHAIQIGLTRLIHLQELNLVGIV